MSVKSAPHKYTSHLYITSSEYSVGLSYAMKPNLDMDCLFYFYSHIIQYWPVYAYRDDYLRKYNLNLKFLGAAGRYLKIHPPLMNSRSHDFSGRADTLV